MFGGFAGLGAKSQYISPENKIQRLQHEKDNYITHKENLSSEWAT